MIPSVPQFNLADEPWIPVGRELVSWRDLYLRAHELDGWFGGPPPFAASLARLTTAITWRISGLDEYAEDVDDFTALQEALLESGVFDPSSVRGYFDDWHDRFWLLGGSHPFAQDQHAITQAPKKGGSVNKFAIDLPDDNTGLWGSQVIPATLSPAVAAQSLVARLFYGDGGRKTPRSDELASGSPWTQKGGHLRNLLSLHPTASDLFTTLAAHCVPSDHDRAAGCPFWEQEPPGPEDYEFSYAPAGPLEVLADRFPSAYLLTVSEGRVDRAFICRGRRDPVGDAITRYDPYVVVDPPEKEGEEERARRARPGRELWREFASLRTHASDVSSRELGNSRVLRHIAELDLLHDVGWTAISLRGDQSKDLAWATSAVGSLKSLFTSAPTAEVCRAVTAAADDLEWRLMAGVACVRDDLATGPSGRRRLKNEARQRVTGPYWADAQSVYWAALATEEDSHEWGDGLRKAALRAFDSAVDPVLAGESFERAEAAARGRSQLARWKP